LVCVSVLELELAPEDGWAEDDAPLDGCDELELPLAEGWAELELEDELGVLGCVVEPAPAEPLRLEELEPDGAALEEPPLALSFFCRSIEVDEELEPGSFDLILAGHVIEHVAEPKRFAERAADPLKRWKLSPIDLKARQLYDAYGRARVDPELPLTERRHRLRRHGLDARERRRLLPQPDGEVVEDEELAPAGAREVSDLLQPAIMAPPNARDTARANVESFMGPPWLGYEREAARIGPRILRSHPAA
jgi:hypothetical protein